MNDPEGWKVLDEIEVKGSFYASKSVSVRCTLAIAAPVSGQQRDQDFTNSQRP